MRAHYEFYYCNPKKLARNLRRQKKRLQDWQAEQEKKMAIPLWLAALGQKLPQPGFWRRLWWRIRKVCLVKK